MKRILMTALLVTALPVMAEKPQWVEDKQQGKGGPQQHQGYDERDQDYDGDRGRDYDRGDRDRDWDRDRDRDRYYDYDYDRYRLSDRDRDRLLRDILQGHYGATYEPERHRYKALPPGLQKKLRRGGDLPPGWRDKLIVGDRIDPYLYRHAEHLPSDLLNRITGRDDGIELLRIGDRIVRVMEGRGTVLDVIDLTDRALGLFD
ncbi:hypothetical protein [Marinobacterium lutimaris]|uniref:Nickel/cobalt transporter regulator n=1 Tax=Marinobacterium lutimaris TaxID=568106 RepID=A0A1H5YH74_9GAMM|nr:hypothetical protein [Marinobacterium lutimaris]SEG23025.1 hypothetical protein SAMN05444390_1011748 [Marinobacterium lutimaris]